MRSAPESGGGGAGSGSGGTNRSPLALICVLTLAILYYALADSTLIRTAALRTTPTADNYRPATRSESRPPALSRSALELPADLPADRILDAQRARIELRLAHSIEPEPPFQYSTKRLPAFVEFQSILDFARVPPPTTERGAGEYATNRSANHALPPFACSYHLPLPHPPFTVISDLRLTDLSKPAQPRLIDRLPEFVSDPSSGGSGGGGGEGVNHVSWDDIVIGIQTYPASSHALEEAFKTWIARLPPTATVMLFIDRPIGSAPASDTDSDSNSAEPSAPGSAGSGSGRVNGNNPRGSGPRIDREYFSDCEPKHQAGTWKTFAMFERMAKRYGAGSGKKRYFMKCDDDAFLVPENLLLLIRYVNALIAHDEPVLIGHAFAQSPTPDEMRQRLENGERGSSLYDGFALLSGGSGYVLNSVALRRLTQPHILDVCWRQPLKRAVDAYEQLRISTASPTTRISVTEPELVAPGEDVALAHCFKDYLHVIPYHCGNFYPTNQFDAYGSNGWEGWFSAFPIPLSPQPITFHKLSRNLKSTTRQYMALHHYYRVLECALYTNNGIGPALKPVPDYTLTACDEFHSEHVWIAVVGCVLGAAICIILLIVSRIVIRSGGVDGIRRRVMACYRRVTATASDV